MIPFYKLEKLPRTQKLRKITKILSMAENRLLLATEKSLKILSAGEFSFFTDAAKLLAKDALFPSETQKLFMEAADIFQTALNNYNIDVYNSNSADITAIIRTLNNIKHILMTETGNEQADWDFTTSDGQLDVKKRQISEGMWIYLEDIRSPFNVGAIFRTAESFGIEKIILSPFCADPNHTRAKRTAMGCIDIIPWERRNLFDPLEEEPIDSSVPVFALETGGASINEFTFPNRGILIAGSEELGVSPRALAAADASLGRVSIPCYGTKASLNVSVALGIALQVWRSKMHAHACGLLN